MQNPDPLASATVVLFVHAHPDDETLATGGLIAELTDRGVTVHVLTATRGEQGEIVPGSVAPGLSGADLAAHREHEVAAACRTLGAASLTFLGATTARAPRRPERRYSDSGMRWVDAAETVAGPGDAAGPDALSLADPAEIAADIAAHAAAVGADALVSYDERGGYGHPDHVALHAPTRDAAAQTGARFVAVASDADVIGHVWQTERHLARVTEALRHHATQVTVDGADVVHVGGQRTPIQTRFVLVD